MEFTAWDKLRGEAQLRVVEPTGFDQDDQAAFVLGADIQGIIEELENGDYVEVYQDIDFTGYTVVQATFKLRGPAAEPSTGIWIFKALIDSVEAARAEVLAGRVMEPVELQVHTMLLTGIHQLAFRLEFE